LGSKVSNFVGLFDYLRTEHRIKASEVVEILDNFPELVLQNKKDLIKRKVDLIQKQSKQTDTYVRNLLRRHPDLFLKYLQSGIYICLGVGQARKQRSITYQKTWAGSCPKRKLFLCC
jgi:hypothetical protein